MPILTRDLKKNLLISMSIMIRITSFQNQFTISQTLIYPSNIEL